MHKSRKAARDKIQACKTNDEFEEWLSMLRITDDVREIARMVYIKGWTRQKIAMETGYSVRQVSRKIAKLHDMM